MVQVPVVRCRNDRPVGPQDSRSKPNPGPTAKRLRPWLGELLTLRAVKYVRMGCARVVLWSDNYRQYQNPPVRRDPENLCREMKQTTTAGGGRGLLRVSGAYWIEFGPAQRIR